MSNEKPYTYFNGSGKESKNRSIINICLFYMQWKRLNEKKQPLTN